MVQHLTQPQELLKGKGLLGASPGSRPLLAIAGVEELHLISCDELLHQVDTSQAALGKPRAPPKSKIEEAKRRQVARSTLGTITQYSQAV